MEDNNTLAVQQQNQAGFEARIKAARSLVAKGATDEEFGILVALATKYDLDPFAREIWCIKRNAGEPAIITTSRDGYLTIANRNPHYTGLQSDVVYSGDKFTKDEQGVHHVYNVSNRGGIIGAYALVHRDDRIKPVYAFAPFKDYNGKSFVWQHYPHAMILKVAESMALKRAFSVSGLTSYEELGGKDGEENKPQEQPQPKPAAQTKPITQQIWERYLKVCDGQINHAVNAMKKITGKDNSRDFNEDDIQKLLADIERRENEAVNTELQTQEFQDADFQDVENEQESL